MSAYGPVSLVHLGFQTLDLFLQLGVSHRDVFELFQLILKSLNLKQVLLPILNLFGPGRLVVLRLLYRLNFVIED